MVEVELPVTAIADLLKPEIRIFWGVQLEDGNTPTESAKASEQAEAETTQDAPQRHMQVRRHRMRSTVMRFHVWGSPSMTPSVFTEGLLDILKEHNVGRLLHLGSRARFNPKPYTARFRKDMRSAVIPGTTPF